MNTDKTLALSDGRHLSYREVGDLSGMPVLYCHGVPGSCDALTADMIALAVKRRLRFIIPERPGYGASSSHEGRTIETWAADSVALMNLLGIARFSVVGYSGGAFFALAIAAILRRRVCRVVLASPIGPNMLDGKITAQMHSAAAALWQLAKYDQEELGRTLQSLSATPTTFFSQLYASVCEADQRLLDSAPIAALIQQHCIASLKNDAAGMLQDYLLMARPWRFAIEDVVQPVQIWHGCDDQLSPMVVAEELDKRLPSCALHAVKNAGHLCVSPSWDDILAAAIS
jgi:pimeloyl-ACP methyl ester carboxylesterase